MNGGYICQPCDKIFSGEAPYKDHIQSEKHQRKINSLKIGDSLQTIDNYKELNIDEHIQKCGSEFKCTVCNVSMNDISMAASHVKGQKHMKTISRLSSPGSACSSAPNLELDSNIKKCGTEYICKACNVFMNDISIVSSHLKGQKHLKTLSKMNPSVGGVASLSLDNSFDSSSSVSDLVANSTESSELENKLDRFIEKKGTEYVCNACIVIMDDLSVAMKHVKGPVHKSLAKMENSIDYKDNVASFIKASGSLNSPDSSAPTSDMSVDPPNRSHLKRGLDHYIEKKGLEYVCNACNVSMNDVSIVSSHLKGQKHLKTLSRLNSSDSDLESPHCVDFKGKLDQSIVKKGLIYVCNACNASMNDISTATSHAKGQKHLKNISKFNCSENNAIDRETTLQSPDYFRSDSVFDSAKTFNHSENKLETFIERMGKNKYKCIECNVVMNTVSAAESHVRGQKHIKAVSALNSSQGPNDNSATALDISESSLGSNDSDHSINRNISIGSPDHVFNDSLKFDSCIEKLGDDYLCRPCNVFMNSDSTVQSHLRGQKHLKNKLHYKGSTNITDDFKGTSPKSLDTDDVYLFNKEFSFSAHSVEEVMSDVKVLKTNDPVTF